MKHITDANKTLADLGIRQFVRNKIIKGLKSCIGSPKKADGIIDEINKDILKEFTRIARDESEKAFAQLHDLTTE